VHSSALKKLRGKKGSNIFSERPHNHDESDLGLIKKKTLDKKEGINKCRMKPPPINEVRILRKRAYISK
jgi:hypothetical protein